MPRKRNNRMSTSPVERRSDGEDDDFFFDDNQSNSGRGPHEPQHRNAANARERARMRVLSKAFCRLKTTLPWVPADTKLSKLDTLRLAASYIAHLRALLQDEPRAAQTFPHPLNLAWPFAFQHGGGVNCAAISQRWSSPEISAPNQITSASRNTDRGDPQRTLNTGDNYSQDYAESGYSEREYEDVVSEGTQCNDSVQYCDYNQYKDNYYPMRSSYSDSMLNA